MQRERKVILFTLIFLFILVSTYMLIHFINRPQLEYIIDDSNFHDFNINGDHVYLRCDIEVRNNTDETLQFYMYEDGNGEQLVLEKKIYAYSIDNLDEKQLFTIEPHVSEKYDVIFIGTSSGINQRQDRNPPQSVGFEVVNYPDK